MTGAEPIAFGPHTIRVLAARPDYGYAEGRFVPGVPGPAAHRHGWDETFYVVSGELVVTIDDSDRLLGPGDFAVAEGGSRHTFAVHSSSPAVFIAGFHPGRGLDYIIEMATTFTSTGPDPARLAALHEAYGVTVDGQ